MRGNVRQPATIKAFALCVSAYGRPSDTISLYVNAGVRTNLIFYHASYTDIYIYMYIKHYNHIKLSWVNNTARIFISVSPY